MKRDRDFDDERQRDVYVEIVFELDVNFLVSAFDSTVVPRRSSVYFTVAVSLSSENILFFSRPAPFPNRSRCVEMK